MTEKKKRVVADYKLAGHIKKVGNTFKVFIKNLAQKENTLHWTTSYPHGYLQLTVKSREFDSYWIALGVISQQEPADTVSMIACL